MTKEWIIVHHSLTRDGSTVSWDAIRRYHKSLGWDDIGYHYGVELVNDKYEILMGRMPNEKGAHTKELNMNSVGIGICCVGNFDLGPPPQEQMDKLIELVRWLQSDFHITKSHVLGHREVGALVGFDWTKGNYKSCPGKRFDMNKLRSYLR